MADEGRDSELPRRARGAAGSASALSARSPLSEEVLRRMQAAVRAERGQAADQDEEHAAEPEPPVEPERLVERAAPITPEPAVKPKPAKVSANHQPDRPRAGRAGRPAGAAASPEPPGRPERPRVNALEKPARGRLSLARMVTSALVVVAAGSLAAAAMTAYAANPAGRGDAGSAAPNNPALERQELAARGLAAAWVVRQVSHTAVVSCDRTMCAALTSARFPARNLRDTRDGVTLSPDLRHSRRDGRRPCLVRQQPRHRMGTGSPRDLRLRGSRDHHPGDRNPRSRSLPGRACRGPDRTEGRRGRFAARKSHHGLCDGRETAGRRPGGLAAAAGDRRPGDGRAH